MKTTPAILRLPQRLPLAQQAATALRDGLAHGLWREHLPGERDLSRQLNISRPTLRAALKLLEKEGRLRRAAGKARVIVSPSRRGSVRRRQPPLVRLLVPFALQEAPSFLFYWIDKLRALLPAAGCSLEIHSAPRCYAASPGREISRLTRQAPADLWVLTRATEPMQRWFAESGLACAVAGSCFPGVNLPSVDFDHRAIGRHAAGQFVARGHRRLAMLIQTPELAGDLESEAGFAEGIAAASREKVSATIVRHDGTPANIRRALDRLLRMPPAPTGFFVLRSSSALAAASELTRRGFKLPADLAVISRDSDHLIGYFSPELARYTYDPDLFGRRLAALLIKLAKQDTVFQRTVRLVPDFRAGETLG